MSNKEGGKGAEEKNYYVREKGGGETSNGGEEKFVVSYNFDIFSTVES